MSDITKINMREFSRVDAILPIEVRIVPPEDRHHIKCYMSGESLLPDYEMPLEVNDPVLSDWLRMLNTKLDAIYALISKENEQLSKIPQKRVNLSGGGLAFDSSERYELGTLLEIKMVLPITLSQTLFLYGEVVDVRQKDEHFQTALKFVTLDDEVREHIVKFVFKIQRDILRQKRG